MADEKGIISKAIDGVRSMGETAKKVVDPITKMNQVFEKLSTTGNTFGNDMIKMTIAAANARMPLDDFARLLQENNTTMGTLAGSVGKGSQVFADLAKSFHASGLTENLRQMGFSASELNEVLALQVGFQKSTYENTAEGQRKATAAAASLAMEMDALTQLTGQSRKEQEENLKRAQADMKLEAKFRLIGAMYGADKEKEARDNFAANYAQMAAKGMGDLYKDFFATGTAMTKASQAQLSMYGQAGMNAAKSATELGKGNAELAKVYNDRAQVEVMALQKTKAFMTTAIYATGDAGEAVRANMKANDTAFHGMQQTMKDHKLATNDVTEALRLQRAAIKEEQQARSGLTQIIRTGGIVADDAKAAAANRVGNQVNNQLNAPLKEVSQGLLMTTPGEDPNKRAKAYQDALVREKEGDRTGKFTPASRQRLMEETMGQIGGDLAAQLLGLAAKSGVALFKGDLKETLKEGFNQLTVGTLNAGEIQQGKPKEGRAGGTLGETGRVVEPKDVHALLHKGEMVLTQEQQKNFVTNVRTDAIADIMAKIQNQAAMSQPSKMPSIDLNKFAKDIATTTSKVEVANWPKEFKIAGGGEGASASAQKPADKPEEKKDEKKDEKKSEQATISEVDARKAWREREAKSLEKQTPTQASVRSVDNEIDKKSKEDPKEESKDSKTTVTVNGKQVDPNSQEGKEAVAFLKEREEKLNQATSNGFDPQKIADALQGQVPASTKKETVTENTSGGGQTEVRRSAEQLDYAKSVILNTIGLTERQQEMHGQLARMTLEDSKLKLETNKKQLDANLEEIRGLDAKANAIEATAKKEGRALTESEEAQIAAIDNEVKEKTRATREMNTIMADENQALEKLIEQKTFAEKNGLEVAIAENGKLVKVTEANSVKIAEQMDKALPVKNMEDLTKKSEELAERRAKIEERLADRQGRVAALREIAGERDLTDQEKRELKTFENGVKRAENNLKRNLEDQAKLDEALGIAKKQTDSKILEQTKEVNKAQVESYGDLTDSVIAARDKMELDAISNDEELEAAQADLAAQAKFTYLDKDKLDDDTDSAMPSNEFAGLDEAIGGQLLGERGPDEKSADNSADKLMSDIKDSLTSNEFDGVDDAIGGQILGNRGPDEKSADNSADNIMSDIKDSLTSNEFDGVDDAIGGQILGNRGPDEKSADNSADKIMSDIKDLLPSNEFTGIDQAIEEQQRMQQNTSGMDVRAEDGTVSKGVKINPETGQSYHTENTSDKAKGPASEANFAPLTMGDFTLGPNGMPIPKPKAEAKGIPNEVKKDEKKAQEEKKQKDAQEAADAKKQEQKPSETTQKKENKTLDDVVKTLETLNSNVNRLISKVEETGNKQVSATKSMSGNLFNR